MKIILRGLGFLFFGLVLGLCIVVHGMNFSIVVMQREQIYRGLNAYLVLYNLYPLVIILGCLIVFGLLYFIYGLVSLIRNYQLK